jgi:hypothetical protein
VTRNRSRLRPQGRCTIFCVAAFAVAWPALVHGAPSAIAPEPPAHRRVLIVADEANDPFMDMVKAEVSAVRGVEIVVRAPAGSLDADARAEHADAAIRKLPSGKGVEVWMSDATSGRSLLRQLVVDERPNGPDQSLVALQTAELLRTSFFPKPDVPAPGVAPPLPTSPTPSVAAASTAPTSSEDVLQAGVGLLESRGGVSPALQAWLSYQHQWSRRFGVVVDVSAPLVWGSVRALEGTADVGVVLAGGGLHSRFRSADGQLFATTSVGGAFASVLAKGQPVGALEGSSTRAYTGLAYLRLSGGWNPARWLGLGIAGVLGTTTSRVRIQFANRDVAEWGMPIAIALLYAEIDW